MLRKSRDIQSWIEVIFLQQWGPFQFVFFLPPFPNILCYSVYHHTMYHHLPLLPSTFFFDLLNCGSYRNPYVNISTPYCKMNGKLSSQNSFLIKNSILFLLVPKLTKHIILYLVNHCSELLTLPFLSAYHSQLSGIVLHYWGYSNTDI